MRFILLCWVSLLFLTSCETKEVKLQQLLLKGNIAFKASQLEQAAYYYEESLKLDSCFADAWNNLGTISFRRGSRDEAIQFYDRAIFCRPDASFYLNRANAHFENKTFFSALQDLQSFEQIKPDSIPARILKGMVLARLKRYDEAKLVFTDLMAKEPLNPEHLVNRGTIFYYEKNFEQSRSDLEKVIKLDSANSEAFNALAMISADENSIDTAYSLIEKALLLSPGDAHFLNNRGYIKILQNKLKEGELDINESMVREPDNPWVYRNKGLIYLKLKDYSSAERLFRQVLSMDSSVDKTQELLGVSMLASGKKVEGCRWLRISGAVTLLSRHKCQ